MTSLRPNVLSHYSRSAVGSAGMGGGTGSAPRTCAKNGSNTPVSKMLLIRSPQAFNSSGQPPQRTQVLLQVLALLVVPLHSMP